MEENDNNEEAQRLYLSEIMRQLTESDRFLRFFRCNYEVQQRVDEDTKTVEIVLIERPPELAAQVLQEMLAEHAKEHRIETAGVDDLKQIEALLGKEFNR